MPGVEVATDEAAAALDVPAAAFREWASRRGLRAARYVRRGRATHAMWDLDAVYEMDAAHPIQHGRQRVQSGRL